MFKINFSKDVTGILLIAVISVFLFAAYNVFFVFPTFSSLQVDTMENEASNIAVHLGSTLEAMDFRFEDGGITGEVKKEARLLHNDFGLWKIRLFSPEGKLIFDDTNSSAVGHMITKRFFYDTVAKGYIYKHFIPKNSRTPGGEAALTDLAVAYAPVMVNGKFAGASEIYYDVSGIRRKADSLFLTSFLMLALLVSALLLAVVIVSLKANRIAGARQKAEEALHRSERLLRSIIETEPECVKLLAADNTLLMINPAGLAMIQASSFEDVKDRPVTDLVIPEHREAFLELTRKVLAGGEGSLEFEIAGLKGRRLWLETNAVPFTNEKGEIAGLLGITRDITSKKRWTATLESSLREKETLLRELYHRTKNNMQVISSLISLQSSSVSDSHVLQMFDDTKNRIRAMALVHEKLYQSRDLSSVNMKEYIRDLADALIESHSQVEGKVALKLDADSITLPIDIIMPCGLIINELISNSLKYAFTGEGGGEIRISFRQTGPGLMEIVYRDNGPGLESAGIGNIRTLGLKLVRNLATKQLGGEIEMIPGRGAEFRIRFKA